MPPLQLGKKSKYFCQVKKELHGYGIKVDDECLYCGEKDSIDHAFLYCRLVKICVNKVIDWFYAANNSTFAPKIEEKLFGIMRVVKGIFVTLDRPFLPVKCKMANFFLMNHDFHSSREA